MLVIGADFPATLAAGGGFSAKMVLNEKGALVFAVGRQHRDEKAEGISYEDDYRGDALAALLSPGRIEIRYHRDFSDERVRAIVLSLMAEPDLAFTRNWQVTYQGRTLTGPR